MNERGERGSSSVEAAIIVPVLLLFLLVIIAGARIALAQQAVAGAAAAGARAASLERVETAGAAAARDAVRVDLDGADLACTPSTSVTGQWHRGLGEAGVVRVTVTCRVRIGDLMIPGLPGEIVITRTAESPIDRYRAPG